MGLSKSEIFSGGVISNLTSIRTIIKENRQSKAPVTEKTLLAGKGIKYGKSGLSAEKAKEYQSKLIDLMDQEKPFKNNELTLNDLAERLSISPHNLSQILNTRLNLNFFDFINQYRIGEVKEDLNPNFFSIFIKSIQRLSPFSESTSCVNTSANFLLYGQPCQPAGWTPAFSLIGHTFLYEDFF